MDMKNYSSFMPSTDSSEDGLSNDEGDGDRSPFQYSPVPPVAPVGSNDESYALDDEICSYSSATSGFSSATTYSAGSSSYPHNMHSAQHNMFNYEPSTQSHSSSSRKRKTEHSDNELSDYGFGDDGASTISNVSNNSKKKKYDFDACAREVEQNFHVDSKAHEMMRKMGYKKGKGLGAHQQGITEPIQESKQRGRSGLGHSVKQLEPANLIWDDSYEEVSVEEYPVWLDGDHLPTLTHNELCNWVKEGPRIMVMDGYTDFCDPELLQDILESKNVFDNLGDRELNTAVKRSNPFETISSGIFLNRAAMKMANMDRVFDYMFTDPVDRNNRPIIGETDLLYFADVCAGPGGFSEYVLWKRNWQAKGIGFTLKNECDFKLEDFVAGTPESFEPFYGRKGDGNVFDPENIESLTKFVMAKTDNLGVHFMMADGGFSVAGQENIQEIMSKQLYLCQLLVALCIVRTGGHFVCKLFDVFTPFSVGLVYLMYRSFQKICIHKPNSSRPANSERYIICKYKRADCEDIRSYMFDLNIHLNNLGPNSDIDVNDCVYMNELMGDSMFFNYITDSNKRLGRRQLVHLKKVIAFCRDPKLVETKQSDLRIKCLEYWKVPSTVRKPDNTSAEAMAAQILKNSNYDFAANPGDELNSEEKLKALFPSLLDWLCIPVGNHNECHFYIGCRHKVYMLRKNGKGWINLDAKIKLELSPGTLVYGEIVEEVTGCNRSQIRDKFFHIIDAFSLGKKNIISRSIPTRLQLCKLYAKALHKHWRIHISTNSYNSSSPIPPLSLRANDYFELKNLTEIFERLEFRINKLRREEILIGLKDELPRLNFDHHDSLSELSDKYFFPVKGLLFYKTTRNPWTVHFSKSHRKIYYYKKGGESVFEKPNDINASAIDCFINRKLWTWDQGVGIKGESPMDGVLHMSQLLEFIKNARR